MGNTITWAAEKFRRDRGRTHRSETKSIGNPRIRVRRWCTQNTSCDEKKDKCSILLAHTFIFTAFNINSSRSSHVVFQHQKILQKFSFLQNNSSIWTSHTLCTSFPWIMKLLHILLFLVYLKFSTNSEQKTQCRFKVALLNTPPYIMSRSLDPGFMSKPLNGLWTWPALVDKQAIQQFAIWIPSLREVKMKCQI